MLKVVFDTNVIVSAFLKRGGTPAAILTLHERGNIAMCVSPAIMEEYEEVLRRDRFRAVGDRAITYLKKARKRFIWVVPEENITAAKHDPDDNMFLECALSAGADYVVTGNARHFPKKKFRGILIVTPVEFIAVMTKSIFSTEK